MLIKTIPEFLIFWLNIPDVKHFNHSAKFQICLTDRIIDLKSCKYKDRSFRYLSYQNDRSYLATVDNNDTDSYGFKRFHLKMNPFLRGLLLLQFLIPTLGTLSRPCSICYFLLPLITTFFTRPPYCFMRFWHNLCGQ